MEIPDSQNHRVRNRHRLASAPGAAPGLAGRVRPRAVRRTDRRDQPPRGRSQPLSDDELEARARAVRDQVRGGAALESVRPLFFALAREAVARVPRPAAVRRAGRSPRSRSIDGHVVEMQTGEGKTLAAVMPAALHALAGRGVARPDVQRLSGAPRRRVDGAGLSTARAVGRLRAAGHDARGTAARLPAPTSPTSPPRKRASITCAICWRSIARDLVHRPFHFALVDEADSLLIDEARVPLVIAGSVGRESSSAPRLAALVAASHARRPLRRRRVRPRRRADRGRDRAGRAGARLRQPARRRRTTGC